MDIEEDDRYTIHKVRVEPREIGSYQELVKLIGLLEKEGEFLNEKILAPKDVYGHTEIHYI